VTAGPSRSSPRIGPQFRSLKEHLLDETGQALSKEATLSNDPNSNAPESENERDEAANDGGADASGETSQSGGSKGRSRKGSSARGGGKGNSGGSGSGSGSGNGNDGSGSDGGGDSERFKEMPIEDELKDSYLTYAMSVIVSRALPDVRDGLKPSQRRILVAMNDLNLGPNSSRIKCAKISGDTSGNYHPHGESIVYPTLVRMAQEWNMRCVLIDKQGNFGSIAGLPPAAMRYTEARMSHFAAMMLEDLKLDTVDYIPTYDERHLEPTVLPSRFPNLLVNGSSGIAVSMATSMPPHNLGEVCDALIKVIEEPAVSIDEIMEILPGPDFPTGGIICGRSGIRRAYHTGRSTIVVRARCEIEESKKGRSRIVVSEIPYQQVRDGVVEKIASLVKTDRIKGISAIRDVSDLKEPVKLLIDIRSDADPNVVLNQLYQFSTLQTSFSMIFLALVDGKPRELTIKQLLEEFIRHRLNVIRRRTQFLLARARKQKHTIEGLLLALADIDRVIQVIRQSKTVAEAKQSLMGIECPASMMERALGPEGFAVFQQERGVSDAYHLTPVQADAILKMTLGQLVNLEQERLGGQHHELLEEIKELLRILSDDRNILEIIKNDLAEIKRKHADARRTEISLEEINEVVDEDLIEEENMVVSISHRGYIKRTPVSTYRAQRRGGKGIKGAKSEEEDPIEHVFAASTHDYLLFFTSKGRVHWRKVHTLPQLSRESRGRALINLIQMDEDERVAECLAIRDFTAEDQYLVMATRDGLVKKTKLKAYGRPRNGGIIAIKLREGDELIDVVVVNEGDGIVLSTANGMAIRFAESDARPMGRNTSGVKGINLAKGDQLVGMVVADPTATLLTVCENGYGKRTQFGPQLVEETAEDEPSSANRYRVQKRGGKGIRDIKTTDRNGKVVSILSVTDDDQILLMTSRGKLQRIPCDGISVIGRNTQGVRIMSLDEADTLVAAVKVPPGEDDDDISDEDEVAVDAT
jgi:DNA gyrase subunit A